MGASGAESLNVAASIFMGQTEAPLTIRPFLPDLTRSELMTVMTSGMAHVSGGIMAAYIAFGVDARAFAGRGDHDRAGHAADGEDDRAGNGAARRRPARSRCPNGEHKDDNFLGAIARGTTDGLDLAINVAAMLISFLALIALTNGILGGIHNWLASRHGVVPFIAAADLRLGVCAGRVGDRRAVA